MQIVYSSPHRSHHYKYAKAMHKAGVLKTFLSAFSRISPRSPLPEVGKHIYRYDFYQSIYLLSLKIKLPTTICRKLAYYSKLQLDKKASSFFDGADIFMFYNGSGLLSTRIAKKRNIITIVEAVNSHILYQEKLLREEHEILQLPYVEENEPEKKRRIAEYEEADYILLPSNFVMQSFIEYGFPPEKLIKVNYGLDLIANNHQTKKNDRQHDDCFHIIYVGSISVRKGLKYLIDAFSAFKHPNKKLTIVGPTNSPSGIEHMQIPENVVFTGVLKGEELSNAYKSGTVFCLPSIEEGLALVLGEALSFGIPIIATINSGASDIITDGKEGFIVPIRDSKSISEKLQYLADNTDIYNNMKKNVTLKSGSLKDWNETGEILVDKLTTLPKFLERN